MLKKIAARMERAELDAGKSRGEELSALYGREVNTPVTERNDDELFDETTNSAEED